MLPESQIVTINNINLTPKAGKTYWKNAENVFKAEHLARFPSIQIPLDQEWFVYYKCIRAKVHAISARKSVDVKIRDLYLDAVRDYLGSLKVTWMK